MYFVVGQVVVIQEYFVVVVGVVVLMVGQVGVDQGVVIVWFFVLCYVFLVVVVYCID